MAWSQGHGRLNRHRHQSISSVTRAKTLPRLPFLCRLTFSSPASLYFSFYLCHCHCLLPQRGARFLLYCPRRSGSISTHRQVWPLEKVHEFFWVLPFGSVGPLLEIKHWFFFFSPALLAFWQRGSHWKGLCQELETVPNNGKKCPRMNTPFVGLHSDKYKWTARDEKALKSWKHETEAFA